MTTIQFENGMKVKFEGNPTQADVEEVAAKLGIGKSMAQSNAPQKGSFVTRAANAVTNFVGAKGITDAIGASIARNYSGLSKDEQKYVTDPTGKEVLGSVLQTGSNFIPGAGIEAGLGRKLLTGAAIGYANDVGNKLQQNKEFGAALKPGLATATGIALPILGKVSGLSDVGKFDKNVANKLEELNMRLSPTEKQNLQKQGKQIASYLADKKIVGTPAQRFVKVDGLTNAMEGKVSSVIDNSGVSIPKSTILERIQAIPEKYSDNLSEYDSVVSKVERVMKTLQSNFGDEIDAKALNKIKRNEWANAYSKNSSEVVNDVSHDVGQIMKDVLDENIPGLDKLNNEYGKLLTAKRVLFKASTRSQAGLLGKTAGLVAGTSIGGAIGGPGGAAVGAYVGPQITNSVSTPLRSASGAMFQKASELINKVPADQRGRILISRKALLNLISRLQNN